MTNNRIIQALLDEMDEIVPVLQDRIINAYCPVIHTEIEGIGKALEHLTALYEAVKIVRAAKAEGEQKLT